MLSVEQLVVTRGSLRIGPVSFSLGDRAYAVLMGPTGLGKTSVLEAVAGLVPATSGSIRLGPLDLTSLPPWKRGLGYVPQDGALFPGLSVEENLGFALGLRHVPAAEKKARVASMAEKLGVAPLLGRSVHKLSGGERQRVALGRALIFDPPLLLLDEPLSALDAATHAELCQLLRSLHAERPMAVLHVTHSAGEAAALATTTLHLPELLAHGRA